MTHEVTRLFEKVVRKIRKMEDLLVKEASANDYLSDFLAQCSYEPIDFLSVVKKGKKHGK